MDITEVLTCPNCMSHRVTAGLETEHFPYGVAPTTVTLHAAVIMYSCIACGLRYTDMTGEEAREIAVRDHLRMEAAGVHLP